MKLRFLNEKYSIIQFSKDSKIPEWLDVTDNFISITRTSEELSIVCKTTSVPKNKKIMQNKNWIIIKIEEVLDLSLYGVLFSILKILKENKISIFSISTYNTDYILIKGKDKNKAKKYLSKYYEIL